MSTQVPRPSSAVSDMRHLRPLTAPEMLDRAFAILATRWRIILPCALLMAGVIALQAMVGSVPEPSPSPSTTTGTPADRPTPDSLGFVLVVALWLVGELAAAVAINSSFQAWLYPRRLLDLGPLMNASLSRLLPFVITRLVFDFVAFVLLFHLPLWLLVNGVQTYSPFMCAVLAAGSIMMGMGILLHWGLVSVVVLVERKGLFTGLNRSIELMRTGQGNALDLPPPVRRLLVGLLPMLFISLTAIAAAFLLYQNFTGIHLHEALFEKGLTGRVQRTLLLTEATVMLVAFPVLWPFVSVLYADCRMRREGLDFQMRLLENGGWDSNALDQEALAGS